MDISPTAYTVKQVAALTGIAGTTLRMWERRYGVVNPERSSSGYRLYSDDDVAMLRAMASLVADGVPASVAARSLDAGVPAEAPRDAAEWAELDLVGAAMSLDAPRLDAVLTEAFERGPVEQVVDEWLLPELARLGRAWEAHDINIADEHFASGGVGRMLGRQFDATPNPGVAPQVLVGLPPGSHHEFGLLSFAICLRRQGVGVVYLGADVPVADWEAAAHTLRPRAAVVGAPQCTDPSLAQEVVDGLRAQSPPVAVWTGGGVAGGVQRAERLPDVIAEAAGEVALALRAGRRP